MRPYHALVTNKDPEEISKQVALRALEEPNRLARMTTSLLPSTGLHWSEFGEPSGGREWAESREYLIDDGQFDC